MGEILVFLITFYIELYSLAYDNLYFFKTL